MRVTEVSDRCMQTEPDSGQGPSRYRRRVLYHTHFAGHNLDSRRGFPCTIQSACVDLTHHLSGCELAR